MDEPFGKIGNHIAAVVRAPLTRCARLVAAVVTRASAPPAPPPPPPPPHRGIQIRDHQRSIHPQHAPPKPRQLAVPARVLSSSSRLCLAGRRAGSRLRNACS